MNTGTVAQIIGPVVDLQFPEGKLPEIYNAVEISVGKKTLVVEVQQHLGDGMVRAVAMDTTDGLKRGVKAVDTGAPISVPVGNEVLGRIFNVLGEVVDNKEEVKAKKRSPIHRPAPSF